MYLFSNLLKRNPTIFNAANVGRPHLESSDDAQLGLHQTVRRGNERLGRKAHQVLKFKFKLMQFVVKALKL